MILIVPAAEPGRGGGHLTRCVNLVKDLRAANRSAFLFLSSQTEKTAALLQSMKFNIEWCINNEAGIRNEPFELIILDSFQTSAEELLRWKKIAPVIGIDEGGKCRDNFDFLIDILVPEKLGKPAANIASPSLLLKNFTEDSKFRFANESIRTDKNGEQQTGRINENEVKTIDVNQSIKILIAFGHEDTAGLGVKTISKLLKMKNNNQFDITLIKGALNTPDSSLQIPDSIKALDAIPNLSEHLCEYELIITHYGLTAYEALFAGTNVLLAHPTKYHRKLAKAAGFKSFSIKNIKKQYYLNSNKERKKHPTAGLFEPRLNNKSLAGLISGFSPVVNKNCPVCRGNTPKKSTARFNDRTYKRCPECGVIYMDRINPAPVEYEKEYFFESYKNQYGKTYLEDFENIKKAGKNRLKIISQILSRIKGKPSVYKTQGEQNKNCELPSLLDIGCAYGPFLAAAKEEGFSPAGIDPAQDAVDYVNQKLHITAVRGFFPIPNSTLPAPFEVITMWYVIEHFKDCVTVLTEIKKLLKPNGIFAFSTPSFSGISGKSNLGKFLSNSPADHFTVWSPKMIKKALSLAGFKVKKTVVSGHHPERFPVLGKSAKNKTNPIYMIQLVISKLFKLGDTFEVYAVNKN
ncbi:MAG: methyltransferase domain-containing protein [Treponema sp.]|nr:methyltransferase domain-containing protein [Treponema sp.]